MIKSKVLMHREFTLRPTTAQATEIRNKIKAGALLLADKERIDRLLEKLYSEIQNLNK